MKGKKLCCGLFLALFITLLSSLSVSSDTSALKYYYNAYPVLHRSIFYNSIDTGLRIPSFSMSFSKDSVSSTPDISVDNNRFALIKYNSTYSECRVQSLPIINSDYYSSPSPIFTITGPAFADWIPFIVGSSDSLTNDVLCRRQSLYNFDSIYGSSYNLSDGSIAKAVDLTSAFFDVGDEFYSSGSVKSLSVPLSFDYSSNPVFSPNIPFKFEFSVGTKNHTFDYVAPNTSATLYVEYFAVDINTFSGSIHDLWDSRVSTSVTCSYDNNYRTSILEGDTNFLYRGMKWTCDFSAPSYMSFPTFKLGITNSDSSLPILSYTNTGVYIIGSSVITNNDDTNSGQYANSQPEGESIEDAPGYHQLYGYTENSGCSEGDWFCNLINLFNFNFLNPFAPIFGMFTSGSDCVNIPIIAGMLGSNETQICPWFSADVRNIVTPVVGLVSIMLLFGFIVRWLGSSSGNLFEDSGHIESPGYSATGGTAIKHGWRRK